ncbi:acetamidase/formamidase family protein [Haloarcula argentinensis]|uniref:Acetamidase/formamidase family protein n=1 Tax=Haloarcula argentinensis TaxID=43776 RepID=A0ABU2EZ11_HALAR|nr:acetamidase/formamidase family protein [Haloarcula argentinensis]EMA24377.1 acetamidase/formamidase [Haloarcula argentinensis DSM 12282]MDS0253507.1 acetamidase/formamidase family protein [Haloarcula argentinensis]
MSEQIQQELDVDRFTLGLVGPDQEWAGTVADGGTVRTHTPPACWGPMITPEFRGGHEVTRPIRVENAEPGDALVVHIKDVEVTSVATSTGSMAEREDAFGSDPFVDHRCPECGTEWPDSVVEGTGEDAIRCAECRANASSFGFEFGYTVAFDEDRSVGLTVGPDGAADLAERADEAMALPDNSRQHPILLYKPDEIPGMLGHLRPFIGNIGTTPSVEFPDSHNAGDFGQFLIGADHDWGLSDESALDARTDGHLDSNDVRPGATLICPVEIDGAGLYVGDLHANQGDGELSLHTTDVSGRTELEVSVIKDLDIDGPLLLPNESDLPDIAKPYTDAEREAGEALAAEHHVDDVIDAAPLQIIGSGATINDATENAFARAGTLFGMSEGEVRARCTFTGGVEIARLPGVVQLSMLAPMDLLEERGLAATVREQYDL